MAEVVGAVTCGEESSSSSGAAEEDAGRREVREGRAVTPRACWRRGSGVAYKPTCGLTAAGRSSCLVLVVDAIFNISAVLTNTRPPLLPAAVPSPPTLSLSPLSAVPCVQVVHLLHWVREHLRRHGHPGPRPDEVSALPQQQRVQDHVTDLFPPGRPVLLGQVDSLEPGGADRVRSVHNLEYRHRSDAEGGECTTR